MMDAIIIQAENEAEILVSVSLRDKQGQLKHFKMNCEVKYDGSYIQKPTSLSELKENKFDKNDPSLSSMQNLKLTSTSNSILKSRMSYSNPIYSKSDVRTENYKVNDSENSCIQILCYLREDIAKLKEITEEKCMMRSSFFQDSFIRRVFHKMRTPLHVICNSLSVNEVTLEELSEVRYHAGSFDLSYISFSKAVLKDILRMGVRKFKI